MIPRYYQTEAVNSLFSYFNENKGNPVIAMPTGTGKSIVIADFLRTVFHYWPWQRIMILTHVRELIEQNIKHLQLAWPTAPIGVYSAGLGQRDFVQPIMFGGVASVVKCIERFGHRDLLIIDEAHLLNPDSSTMYQRVIEGLKAINPHLKVIGLTATWYRLGQGLLTTNGIFTDLCYNICNTDGFTRLISEGYLSTPIPRQTQTALDVANVDMAKGEYIQSQLQKAVDKNDINNAVVQEMIKHGHNRQAWLIFCSGIEHAEHVAEILNYYGIPTGAVHSKTKDREKIIDDFKAGRLRAVTNNNVLTTGFDFPAIDMIGMLRPTLSPGLWVQMVGRGTRPSPETGKTNCLVLDFARNTLRLGPIDDPRIPRTKGANVGGDAPVKICDVCGTYNHARAKFCIGCGTEFVFAQKMVRQADTRDLISTGQPLIETYDVDRTHYNRHIGKKSGIANIKITYFCGLKMFQEYVSFDHIGFAKHRANEWWRQRSADEPPLSTDLALQQIARLRTPRKVRVWINRPHPQVLSYIY